MIKWHRLVQGSKMRGEMLEAMRVMANEIVGREAMATKLAEHADRMDDAGFTGAAEVMRDKSRTCRVRALELGGRLAVLQAEYAMRFQGPEVGS